MRVREMWLLGVLAACTGCPALSNSGPPSQAAGQVPAAVHLIEVRPLTVTFGGLPIARMFADGHTEAVGENPPGGAMSPGPTLHADGTIELTKVGATARISSGGEIYVTAPGGKEALFAHVAGEHLALAKNGVHVDGNMMVFDDGRDDVGKIEGAVDAAVRRTALVMFAAFFIEKSLTP